MPLPIEEYALIGDTQTAALVGSDGSIDWLCLPRFDSPACFAALVGDESNGRFVVAPVGGGRKRARRYRPQSLVLETELESESGVVRIVDCMPLRRGGPRLVRLVQGVLGEVPVRVELAARFGYGRSAPWIFHRAGRYQAVAGPDSLVLDVPSRVVVDGVNLRSEFVVRPGEEVPLVLSWHASHQRTPAPIDAVRAVRETDAWWSKWSSRCRLGGDCDEAVLRSLITLKALIYAPTGGIVAAPTTSLPECLGGERNWDYRYCWIRDAAFTLHALLSAGYREEAKAWRDWLLRALAGTPEQLQIMYGVAGERDLSERTLPWLGGYEGSRPVRVGNAAWEQHQLDVFGELIASLELASRGGIRRVARGWELVSAVLGFLESVWDKPDEGMWEVRGPRRHFTHSKVMAWVAFDRATKIVSAKRMEAPVERWAALRDEIHRDVCARGYDARRGAFTQSYGSAALDANLLTLPLVGFLPATDARVQGTLRAIMEELSEDGFVRRYLPAEALDGIPSDEGYFLPCTFWVVDNLALAGRVDEAQRLFERLLAVRNDVGLLAEEYDPRTGRMLGNFPQAFTHVSLVNSARILAAASGGTPHGFISPGRAGSLRRLRRRRR